MTLKQLEDKIADLTAQLDNDIAQMANPQTVRTKYLGKKGEFNDLARVLKQMLPEDRKEAGKLLNQFKTHLETVTNDYQAHPVQEKIDLTIPGQPQQLGHIHPVSQAMHEITHIFEKIGFTRVRYPELDWDWYVFEALNMPQNHPARDEWETFFMDYPNNSQLGKLVLTTHTSNGQVHEMQRLKQPPIRMINISRCYRRQQDATHVQMFHQFEGLVVDENINIANLKGTIDHFAKHFFGPNSKSRIRPFHFQFTEPSFEVDFSCHICGGTGLVNDQKCKFCKSGWHEVGGAGMVHPNVLKAGGIDSDKYTGFAFGWGIERTYAMKPGINIDDIRLIYGGDLQFLSQF